MRRKIKKLEDALFAIHKRTSVYYNDTRNIAITNIAEVACPKLKKL